MSFLNLRSRERELQVNSFPLLTTNSATNIQQTQADGNGVVVNDGGSATTVRGFCWSTNPQPTTADSTVTTGSGTGAYTATMTGLSASTVYYYRAYATNPIGTGYGDSVAFTTSAPGGGGSGNDWPIFSGGDLWGWRYS